MQRSQFIKTQFGLSTESLESPSKPPTKPLTLLEEVFGSQPTKERCKPIEERSEAIVSGFKDRLNDSIRNYILSLSATPTLYRSKNADDELPEDSTTG